LVAGKEVNEYTFGGGSSESDEAKQLQDSLGKIKSEKIKWAKYLILLKILKIPTKWTKFLKYYLLK
jgi:hypothetical protein